MFSFIVSHRNRDLERVKRCLQSIENQDYRNFEIIFIDYGNEPQRSQEVKELCSLMPSVRYMYANTRGWLWCRSHALNLGMEEAKYPYIVVVDIDIIYCKHFTAYLVDKMNKQTFLNYACYYLPKEFTNYESLDPTKQYNYEISDFSAKGLLIVAKDIILSLGGFDTVFTVWGLEDRDMFHRIEDSGIKNIRPSVVDLPTYHQWHPTSNQVDAMPRSWLEFMRTCWETKPKGFNAHISIDKLMDMQRRPALQYVENPTKDGIKFSFGYPFNKAMLDFLVLFQGLQTGQLIAVRQSFDAIPKNADSWTALFFKQANKFFEKVKISYRVTEIQLFEKELIEFYQVRDFLFYFIYTYTNQILDYYWQQDGMEALVFVVVKK
jgi:GT2 family glycosyltransferase